MQEIVKRGMSEAELLDRDKHKNIPGWLDKHGGRLADYAFLPIHSRYKDAFIGIRRSTLEFVDIIEVPPPF
jgi:hypothetical protein